LKISQSVYLIGSGSLGCSITHENDCNVYAIDGGGEFALVDSGCGVGTEHLIENLKSDGVPLDGVRWLLLTHGHLDHSGGARSLRDQLHLQVAASAQTASALEAGDEEAISLGAAKRAGIYPSGAVFQACPVDRTLREGDRLTLGVCTIDVLETPGHSRDMISFLVRRANRQDLFCGDTIFHGGRILLQDVSDCDIPAYSRTLRGLGSLAVDGLYPGHLTWSEQRGQRHIEKANEYLDRLLLPPNLI
jgi:glyoxylase-like metal-dependent hydrolase (beta-lactamase superfamily II)